MQLLMSLLCMCKPTVHISIRWWTQLDFRQEGPSRCIEREEDKAGKQAHISFQYARLEGG